MTRTLLTLAMVLALAQTCDAQLLRQTFRTGTPPGGWTYAASDGAAAEAPAADAARGIVVVGTGSDSTWWQRNVAALKPRATYRIRFAARSVGASGGGCVISGLDCCNRDFGVTADWKPYTFIFTTPDDVSHAILRLGQWHWKGIVRFESVELTEVQSMHRRTAAGEFGANERIDGAGYHFLSQYEDVGSNSSRLLAHHTAGFNSNRWVFGDGAEVAYRHDAGGAEMRSASVRVTVGYHEGGAIAVAASRDGTSWVEAGRAEHAGRSAIEVPADVFPTKQLYVRLTGAPSETADGGKSTVALQVVGYKVDASLKDRAAEAAGATSYLNVTATDPATTVRVVTLGAMGSDSTEPLQVEVRSTASGSSHAIVSLALRPESGRAAAFTTTARLRPGITVVRLPYHWSGSGRVDVALNVFRLSEGDSRRVFSASAEEYISPYFAADYGYALPPAPAGAIWWCESTYKINPHRPAPGPTPGVNGTAIRISAARREREHAQLVLRPAGDPGPIHVSAGDLHGPDGARIAAAAIEVRVVGYVTVEQPTDRIGVAGDWPDPLPALKGAWRPRSGRNNPLWITVTVPTGAPAGEYAGEVTLHAAKWTKTIPLNVHVWGFALPEHTALRSGFGIDPGNIRRYHNLKSEASLDKVWDYYMRAFANIHLSPYDPMALAGYKTKQTGPSTVDLDFSLFDKAAHHYLDGLGFNAYTIGVQGLGGGRFPNVSHGSFLGKAAGTPEYAALMTDYGRKLTDHLRKNGWLDKAYVYWYDEPSEADYPLCREGGETIKRYAPGLKRMMTEQVEEPLKGYVDLWCPITPNYNHDKCAERQKQGEEVWWYVCTGPKEPFCTLFIDHPATDLRMWLWLTWKYNVQGILIWATNWWTSPQRKEPGVQNPWTDPMSYADSDGVWGNGDGRFFYPPNRDPNAKSDHEYIEAPIVSMRWELLGKGIDDWTYFRLLSELVEKARRRGDHSPEVQRAARLLTVPDAICHDMTTFTVDPQLLFHHREVLAQAIVAMSRGGRGSGAGGRR